MFNQKIKRREEILMAERICKLILKYCSDDISQIQHIKIFCDKLLKDYDTDIDRERSK